MSGLPPAPGETSIFRLVMAIRQLFEGRSNAGGTVTLTAGATTTTVAAVNCGQASNVFLTPKTATAATALATTYILAANVTNKQFIITHASAASTDRTFGWIALG